MIRRTLQVGAIVVAAVGLIAWMAGGGNVGRGGGHLAVVETAGHGVRLLAQPFDRSSREEIVAVARETSFDLRYGTGDQQRLTVGECPYNCRYGPSVEIQAASHSHALSETDFAAGRFVGRIINHSKEPYTRLNLAGLDTSYVWVDKADGKWRAVYVPVSPDLPVLEREMSLESHTQEPWKQSGARWITSEGGEVPWFTCTVAGCCKIDP